MISVYVFRYWHCVDNALVLQSFVSKRIIPVSVILNVEQIIKVCICCMTFSTLKSHTGFRVRVINSCFTDYFLCIFYCRVFLKIIVKCK